jgi:hypothetical protein
MTATLAEPDLDIMFIADAEEIHIMECPDGKTLTWRTTVPDEVIAAQAMFTSLAGPGGQGFLAYAPDADNVGGTQLHRFDETVPRILYTAPLTGG